MDELNNFTLSNLHAKLALPDAEFDGWLQGLGLLHQQRICDCGGMMVRKAPNLAKNERYGPWRCNRNQCKAEKGFLVGTFFQGLVFFSFFRNIDLGSHLTTKKIFQLSYLWSQEYCKLEQIERELDIGRPTIIDWRNFLRDVCAEYFQRNPVRIGGPGILRRSFF